MQSAAPADPSWLHRLSHLVLRLGVGRSTLLLTLAGWLAAVVLSEGFVALSGLGDPLQVLLVASGCSLLLPPLLCLWLLRLMDRLAAARRELDLRATRDGLTGLLNRGWFTQLADRELVRCRRYDIDCALLLVDADRFKHVNDSHGRACGDALLREIARTSGGQLRGPDLIARLSGADLVVLLPHTDPLGAIDAAERIRGRVAELQVDWQGQRVGATVSVGVAALGMGHTSLEGLLADAGAALQSAKEAGRNCVRAAPIQPRRSGEAYPVISK